MIASAEFSTIAASRRVTSSVAIAHPGMLGYSAVSESSTMAMPPAALTAFCPRVPCELAEAPIPAPTGPGRSGWHSSGPVSAGDGGTCVSVSASAGLATGFCFSGAFERRLGLRFAAIDNPPGEGDSLSPFARIVGAARWFEQYTHGQDGAKATRDHTDVRKSLTRSRDHP